MEIEIVSVAEVSLFAAALEVIAATVSLLGCAECDVIVTESLADVKLAALFLCGRVEGAGVAARGVGGVAKGVCARVCGGSVSGKIAAAVVVSIDSSFQFGGLVFVIELDEGAC